MVQKKLEAAAAVVVGTHFYRIGYHIFKEKRVLMGEVLAISDEMHVLTLVMLSKKTSVKLGATIKTYWK